MFGDCSTGGEKVEWSVFLGCGGFLDEDLETVKGWRCGPGRGHMWGWWILVGTSLGIERLQARVGQNSFGGQKRLVSK